MGLECSHAGEVPALNPTTATEVTNTAAHENVVRPARSSSNGSSGLISLLFVFILGPLLNPWFLVDTAGSLPQLLVKSNTTRADSLRRAATFFSSVSGIPIGAVPFQCADNAYGEWGLPASRIFVCPY